MREILQDSFRHGGFPAWVALRHSGDTNSIKINFNLTMQPDVHSYTDCQRDSKAEFGEATTLIRSIQKCLENQDLNSDAM